MQSSLEQSPTLLPDSTHCPPPCPLCLLRPCCPRPQRDTALLICRGRSVLTWGRAVKDSKQSRVSIISVLGFSVSSPNVKRSSPKNDCQSQIRNFLLSHKSVKIDCPTKAGHQTSKWRSRMIQTQHSWNCSWSHFSPPSLIFLIVSKQKTLGSNLLFNTHTHKRIAPSVFSATDQAQFQL